MLRVNDFIDEQEALQSLVRKFGDAMRSKLKRKYLEGYTDWDNPALYRILQAKLLDHVARGFDRENMVDIGNLAAMLWNMAGVLPVTPEVKPRVK